MIRRSRKLAALGLLVALASAVPALAQPAAPAPPYPAACSASSVPSTVSDSAHSIYQGGKAYYDDANYDAAILQFREAYKKDCAKHDLLIIISRAYELKGDKAAAINALETYLERVPTSPDAPQHRTRIENLKKQLAAVPPPTATAPPPRPVEMREHTIPPWIVTGVGAAGIVAGIIVVAVAPSFPAGCNKSTNTCARGLNESDAAFANRQDTAGTAKSQPVIGAVVIGAGAVLVIGGLLWHFIEPTGPVESTSQARAVKPTKPSVVPQVAPGFAGLSLGGNF